MSREPRITNRESRITPPLVGQANRGFTLIEAMAATAVLGLGLALIFQGLFTSLNAYDYYANYLSILPRSDEKIWEAQDRIKRLGPQANLDTSGEWANQRDRRFKWGLGSSLLDKAGGLYKLNLRVSWNEGNRKVSLQREAYALYNEKE